ncbi:MAG: sodium:solute symporter family protein [Bacteroidales bacterium]
MVLSDSNENKLPLWSFIIRLFLMNLNWIDWSIVAMLFALMLGMALLSKTLLKSVSDFIATGRTGGRYIISMFQGTAALGAITIVGALEQNYYAGFNSRWWEMPTAVILVGMSVSGWVVYRFRQTRALTMAEFFQMRYNKAFRIFAGMLAFLSGIVNMIIFPAVSAKFFIYFCGIPEIGTFAGYSITYIIVTAVMVLVPLFFIFSGGHIAIMFTDFIQGTFVNIVFVLIVILLLVKVGWTDISQVITKVPPGHSLINPFDAFEVQDFNPWFFFISMFGLIYTKLSWQGNASFNVAAKSAHEAKMADILTNWRLVPQWGLFLVIVPIIAFTVAHHENYKVIADSVNAFLSSFTVADQSQLRVPMILNQLLPVGVKGAFAAIMLAAAITCHNTYMHSWGSIFIQDVVLPIRNKPFKPKDHIKYLKMSVAGVALTIFILSIVFQQTEKIFLFLNISGAIYVGGSGAVIIGGLYWRRGSTIAAWAAMITGSIAATLNIVLNNVFENFPINGQWGWFIAMVSAIFVYIMFSYLFPDKKDSFNRIVANVKKHENNVAAQEEPIKGWKTMLPTKEFTFWDKVVYWATTSWTAVWVLVFIVGTLFYFIVKPLTNDQWMMFWKIYTYVFLSASVFVTIWFTIGGVKNLKEMITKLRSNLRDDSDDGFISKNEQ